MLEPYLRENFCRYWLIEILTFEYEYFVTFLQSSSWFWHNFFFTENHNFENRKFAERYEKLFLMYANILFFFIVSSFTSCIASFLNLLFQSKNLSIWMTQTDFIPEQNEWSFLKELWYSNYFHIFISVMYIFQIFRLFWLLTINACLMLVFICWFNEEKQLEMEMVA